MPDQRDNDTPAAEFCLFTLGQSQVLYSCDEHTSGHSSHAERTLGSLCRHRVAVHLYGCWKQTAPSVRTCSLRMCWVFWLSTVGLAALTASGPFSAQGPVSHCPALSQQPESSCTLLLLHRLFGQAPSRCQVGCGPSCRLQASIVPISAARCTYQLVAS